METLVNIAIDTPLAIKGCSYIYAPEGQAGEYAPLAANPYRGCGHGCSYCYVPLVLKMKRDEFDAGATARPDYLVKLEKDAKKYQAAGIAEQVFFSFTTDVYSPFDTSLTRPSLQIVQEHGMGICVLTKGGSRALADIDLYRPDRDCFASTLTSVDDAFSKKWERNAAQPDDRIATLKKFHDRGIFTWVSLEPTLSVEASLAIVEATHEFVDHFKIGRANYLKELTRTTDWEDYTHRMIDLCGKLGVSHYIKQDLQRYLPTGYYNPLRRQQHHGPKEPATMEIISQNLSPIADELATTVAISPVSQEVFQEIISEDATEALVEFETLEADINERTAKWKSRFADVMAEFEEEIMPLLDRMNSLLSHHHHLHTPGLPGWGVWYEKYRRSINLKMTMRTVQRKLAQFRGEEPTRRTPASRGTKLTPEQASAAKLLEDAKQELGAAAAAGNEPAAAIIAEYEQAYEKVMADAEVASAEPDAAEATSAEEVYKLLSPLLYSYYLSDTQAMWAAAAKAYQERGEKLPEHVRTRFYENYIVRNRPYAPYPEILNAPWPSLKVDDTLPISTRVAKGIGPPMWLCIKEPNGDTVECLIDRAGDGKCTRVRRVLGTAVPNNESLLDFPITPDAALSESGADPVEPDAPAFTTRMSAVPEGEGGVYTGDETPVPLQTLAYGLLEIADELGCAWGLEEFACSIEAIAERMQDRKELNKRMNKVDERMSKRPKGWRPNSDMLMLQLRRDRRFIEDMKNILRGGGTTYRGQRIWGKDDNVFIFRFTREEIRAELEEDLVNQLGVGGMPEHDLPDGGGETPPSLEQPPLNG